MECIGAVLERMNARIALAAARAAKHPERFIQWIDDRLEQDHRLIVEANVGPVLALLGDTDDSPFAVDRYFRLIREGLLVASECQPEELLASVEKWRKGLNADVKGWFLNTLGVDEHVKQT